MNNENEDIKKDNIEVLDCTKEIEEYIKDVVPKTNK